MSAVAFTPAAASSLERGEIKVWLKTLSPEQRKIVESNPFIRAKFERHVLEVEALYRKAVKAGLDKDPEVKQKLELLKKETLAKEWVEREVAKRLKRFRLSDEDLLNYYRTHIEEFKGRDSKPVPFKDVKGIIADKLKEEYRKNLIEQIIDEAIKEYQKGKSTHRN